MLLSDREGSGNIPARTSREALGEHISLNRYILDCEVELRPLYRTSLELFNEVYGEVRSEPSRAGHTEHVIVIGER